MRVDIAGEFSRLLTAFVDWIPKLITVILVLVIGYIIARVLKYLAISGLRALGFDRRVKELPAQSLIRRITYSPSESVGGFVYWLVMIVTITIAILEAEIPALSQLVLKVYDYVPNILAAIVILSLALGASAGISSIVNRLMGDTPTGRILSTVIPVVILSISGFAILEQLRLAPTIVTTTYVIILGSIALGLALAFGLGGRTVAERILEDAYKRGRVSADQARKDMEEGRKRAEQEKKRLEKELR